MRTGSELRTVGMIIISRIMALKLLHLTVAVDSNTNNMAKFGSQLRRSKCKRLENANAFVQ